MKVLFIGGTGIISTACSQLALKRGFDLTLATRGQSRTPLPTGARALVLDVHSDSAADALGSQHFDVVVDWIAYTPADIERDLRLFSGRTRQFFFISSASAYEKPPADYRITETTPLRNPFWQYSRDKIACEERLMRAFGEDRFPAVIVRPSLTYGDTLIPLVMNSWNKPYTVVDRMLKGKPVIVPGDGTSLWVITHNTDFAKGLVGLFGNEQAVGEAFHITTDEVHTWNQFFLEVGAALGVQPKLVHISSEFIARCLPDKLGSLLGDKSYSVVFDNSKIKRFVPDFRATTNWADGVRRSLAWFDADPARKQIDDEVNSVTDRLIAGYQAGLETTAKQFANAGVTSAV